MHKGFTPIILLVIATLAIAAFFFLKGTNPLNFYNNNIQNQDEYKKTDITVLISNLKEYDAKKVQVTGKFINSASRPLPMCAMRVKKPNPEVIDQYQPFVSPWAISNGTNEVGVVVIDNQGIQTSTLPSYSDNQEIALNAVTRLTTVEKVCDPNTLYQSIYLEVKASEVGIISKTLPSTIPNVN